MFFDGTNFTAGKTHNDTLNAIDDVTTVLFGQAIYKISQIRLISNTSVVGVQFWYKVPGGFEIQGNESFGTDRANSKDERFTLGDDEFITEVFGREGNIIDHLGFRTNKGRTFEAGGYGGNAFQYFAKPGQHFATFYRRLGGHLHQLNSQSQPLPTATFSSGGFGAFSQPQTGGFGAYQQPQTGGFDVYSQPQSGGFGAYQQPQTGGFGAQTQPQTGGFGTYQQPQSGGFGAQTQPQTGGFGAYQQPQTGGFGAFGAPQTQTFPGVVNFTTSTTSGGLGEFSTPPYQASYQTGFNSYDSSPLKPGVRRSARIGGTNPDTRHWDDYVNWLQNDFLPPDISSVTLYADDQFVAGIDITYKSNGINQAPVRHSGSKALGGNLRSVTLNLAPGETIVDISGRGGNVIDYLIIRSSYGQKIEIGGYGGNPFQNIVAPGSRIVGFGGGVNGHLHNVYVYLV